MFARIAPVMMMLVVLFSSPLLAQQATKQERDRLVVVISLDGFPAYAFDDPRLPVPTLRRLMAEGATASAMLPVNPTVTWPNHTAIVTGVNAAEHQVLFNGELLHPANDQPPVMEPWRPKEEMVHAPTVYDLAYQAGLTTAQVDWVAIHQAKTITWQFPENPDPKGAIERELIAAGTVTEDQLRNFDDGVNQTWQDQIWTAAAVDILEKHKPNLLLFHLLDLDNINHEYGPKSVAYYPTLAYLDDRVHEILQTIEKTGRLKETTILVVSDHGFRTIHHTIHANVLLKEKGFIREVRGVQKASAWVMADGGVAMVYVTDPAQRTALVPKLRALFQGAEGVDRIFRTEEFRSLGLPTPAESDQAPDLLLTAKPDYSFNNETDTGIVTPVGSHGTHGFLNSDPQMQAIFIGWGKGIKKGVQVGQISNLEVAPTIAALLGLEMKSAKGNPIQGMLDPSVVLPAAK